MEHAEQALRRAVAERLKELGTNAFAVEQQHGLPEDAIRSILNGTKKLGTTLNKAQAVCEALDLELYVGVRRQQPGQSSYSVYGFSEDFPAVDAGIDTSENDAANATPPASTDARPYLHLPWHPRDWRRAPQPLAWERAWLTSRCERIEDLAVVQIHDTASSLAVVDVAAHHGDDGRWAIKLPDKLIQASVWWDSGNMMMLPDGASRPLLYKANGALSPILLGKIIWVGGSV